MPYVTLAAVELNQTPMDWPGNEARIRAALDDGRRQGAGLVCFPELCLTGYGCEDAFLSPHVARRAWEMLEALVPATNGLVVCFGLPLLHRKAVWNVAALCVDGRLAGLVPKRFLAGDGIHYEPRWFKPWPVGVRESVTTSLGEVPLGDVSFDVGGVRVGLEICEEAWVASRPGAALAARGVDVVLNPSASHFAFGKREVRRRFVLDGSRAFHAAYVYANLLGNESGRVIYDGGAMVAHDGELIAAGPRFSFADHEVRVGNVDLDVSRSRQAQTHGAALHSPDLGTEVRVPFSWPAAGPASVAVDAPAWESGPSAKEEEFTRAVALGLFDYARKSHASGFVVSLSGGADSAACACLVSLANALAVHQLGVDRAAARWRPSPLLTTAYQSTRHSGAVTREAARVVARGVGARHVEWDVDPLVAAYTGLAASAMGRAFDWSGDDVALQNIQARARAPGVWMLANLQGALLLSTSNRSEAAVGYATMDGDTAGGLAPLAGIDKHFLRGWLRWLERSGPHGVGAMPFLAAVNEQQPTAELRPAAQHQTDESDLMPYEVLERLERWAVRDRKSPTEVAPLLAIAFPTTDALTRTQWIRRFFTLFAANQWKRERYAPSFHLDDENLDPRSWLRLPILSGGYREELVRLGAGAVS
ncbi:MAG: Glutamine-dependent synthetase [Pseudomonadota bacterium]|jgi:NAD+ synthase (glutamine-hydrolysing)